MASPKAPSLIVKVTRDQHRQVKKESRLSGVSISNIVRARVFPDACPCGGPGEHPGPHIVSCPYIDPTYEPSDGLTRGETSANVPTTTRE